MKWSIRLYCGGSSGNLVGRCVNLASIVIFRHERNNDKPLSRVARIGSKLEGDFGRLSTGEQVGWYRLISERWDENRAVMRSMKRRTSLSDWRWIHEPMSCKVEDDSTEEVKSTKTQGEKWRNSGMRTWPYNIHPTKIHRERQTRAQSLATQSKGLISVLKLQIANRDVVHADETDRLVAQGKELLPALFLHSWHCSIQSRRPHESNCESNMLTKSGITRTVSINGLHRTLRTNAKQLLDLHAIFGTMKLSSRNTYTTDRSRRPTTTQNKHFVR